MTTNTQSHLSTSDLDRIVKLSGCLAANSLLGGVVGSFGSHYILKNFGPFYGFIKFAVVVGPVLCGSTLGFIREAHERRDDIKEIGALIHSRYGLPPVNGPLE